MRLTCLTTHDADRPAESPASASASEPRTIRAARDTGPRNLLHDTDHNQLRLEIVQLALELLAGMPMPALTRPNPPLGTQTPAPAAARSPGRRNAW
jgi:hypothetical protein